MPPNKYLAEKAVKKKTAMGYVWMMIGLASVFILVVIKFAVSGAMDNIVSTGPSSDDVYTIAKDFVRPTLKSPDDAEFSDSEYQFGTKTDSIYVIKSSVQTGGQKTDFEITLKYLGGSKTEQNNWQMIDMKEN